MGRPKLPPKIQACLACKKDFIAKHSKVKYCSIQCRAIGRKSGKVKTCPNCNKEYYVILSQVEKGILKYCSQECYFQSRWGDSHFEIRQCKFCQKEYQCFVSDQRVTCSKRCSKLYRSQQNQGEKSRFWRGGKVAPYHTEWKTYRRLALERDGYKCTRCGGTDRIQVHHINPYRYSQSHELSNLTTLCRSCHSSEEYKVNKLTRDAFRQVQLTGYSKRLKIE